MKTLIEAATPLTLYAVRDWLRTQNDLIATLGNDRRCVDLSYTGSSETYITLYRAGGFPVPGRPFEASLITFHCWGASDRAAALVAQALTRSLGSLSTTRLNKDVVALGARVQSTTDLAGEDGHSRYVVVSTINARHSPIPGE